jgi:prepilin-type N-terminal cleavage/methylation domain-containing protein/prepilin-type processing-associated H-X9-DG protein
MMQRFVLARRRRRTARGFSLIELLVVIGIIAILVGILMPTLSAARRHAKKIQCMTQLRDLGHVLQIYQGVNHGWLYPCWKSPNSGKTIPHWGTAVPPHERWPMILYKVTTAPNPLPYDPANYDPSVPDPVAFPVEPFTPKGLVCPADDRPAEAHSYILNAHLCEREIKAGDKNFGGLTVSDVILAGEKRSLERDYYMQADDFERVVEKYRHGVEKGTNFLYMDGHVGHAVPSDAMQGIDPWDLNTPVPETP